MKILFTTALIISAAISLVHAQEGQLRLRPSDINALTSVNAGAGTSGVSGIQTRTLKGDATKSWIYTIQLTIPANVRIESHTLFFFNDTATTEIYTLSLHDAL